MQEAVRFIIQEGVLEEESYPYHAEEQAWHPWKYVFRRHHHPLRKRLQIGSADTPPSFADVKEALAFFGPLMMRFIIGDPDAFDAMSVSAIPVWTGPWAQVAAGNPVGHAVLIVGSSEGSTECSEPHLIIQNSWGDNELNMGVFFVPATQLHHFSHQIHGLLCVDKKPSRLQRASFVRHRLCC